MLDSGRAKWHQPGVSSALSSEGGRVTAGDLMACLFLVRCFPAIEHGVDAAEGEAEAPASTFPNHKGRFGANAGTLNAEP